MSKQKTFTDAVTGAELHVTRASAGAGKGFKYEFLTNGQVPTFDRDGLYEIAECLVEIHDSVTK